MFTVSVVVLAGALFLAMVLNLALKPTFSARLTTICMVTAVLGGLIVYGAGFAESTGDLAQSVIRTPLSVVRMFVGVNELSAIAGSSVVRSPAGQALFWLLHLLAFYSMASAAMITIGAEALRSLRFLLSRRGDLTLIYGINEDSVALGRECREKDGSSVVFVADSASPSTVTEINDMGMSVMTGSAAVQSADSFVRKLRIRRRKLTVYAMDRAEEQDLFYALRLKDALERAGVSPEKTCVTLPGAEDIIASMLQVSDDGYGFGYVNVFDPGALAARAMIRLCPPWDFLSFDSRGMATEDFECVVVGFGRCGQAVLKQLIMNGQFTGAGFRAAIFSPHYEEESGYLYADAPELLRNYDIVSFDSDARSRAFYDYVGRRLGTLKLIAVCTGDEELNGEISDNLMLYLKRRGAEQICVVQCGREGVLYQESVGSPIRRLGIYSRDMLSAEDADRYAILLNDIYDRSDRSPWEKWVACDTFSKMSSRASADFVPAFLKAAGLSREEVLAGKWPPEREMLEVLGETEHRRWNAFHFAMGYVPMSRQEFEARGEYFLRCRAEGTPCSDRIAKDARRRSHACLIPWEELNELSARERELTGRAVDYQQADINNVLALPLLLRAGEKEAGR